MIEGTTRLVGLIGDPVSHSRSPRMHNAAFAALDLDLAYVPLRVAAHDLAPALRGLAALGFIGANVTIPHKEGVARGCDDLTPAARAAGSVNTVTVRHDSSLLGDSTDGAAVVAALAAVGHAPRRGVRARVLGAGGSARAVAAALVAAGAAVEIEARRPQAAAALVAALGGGDARITVAAGWAAPDVLVNCTPLGGASALQESPVPADLLGDVPVVCDLAYRPDARPTVLCAEAARLGCGVVDGLEVLVRQGALAFESWLGRQAPLDVMRAAARA